MYKYVLNSVLKISMVFARYFEYYTVILRGAVFSWTCCRSTGTVHTSAKVRLTSVAIRTVEIWIHTMAVHCAAYYISKTKSPNKKILLRSVLCSFKFSITMVCFYVTFAIVGLLIFSLFVVFCTLFVF